MRQTCIVALILAVSAMLAVAADTPAKPVVKQNPAPPLKDKDRLMVREGQLVLAQAHIARLQAEAEVKAAETRIVEIVQTLKKQYACPDCTLNSDFTWTPAPEPKPVETKPGVTSPTPKKQGGANQKKE